MEMITVILLLLNIISGCFSIVKYVLADSYEKKIGYAFVGALNWVAVFVLIMTLIRQVG